MAVMFFFAGQVGATGGTVVPERPSSGERRAVVFRNSGSKRQWPKFVWREQVVGMLG